MGGITTIFTPEALASADVAYADLVGAADVDAFLDGLADLRSAVVQLDATGEDSAVQTFLGALHMSPDIYRRMSPERQEAYRTVIAKAIRANHALFARARPPVATGVVRFASHDAVVATVTSILKKNPVTAFAEKLGLNAEERKGLDILCQKLKREEIPAALNQLESGTDDLNTDTGIRQFLRNLSKAVEQNRITSGGVDELIARLQLEQYAIGAPESIEGLVATILEVEGIVVNHVLQKPAVYPLEKNLKLLAVTTERDGIFYWDIEHASFVDEEFPNFSEDTENVLSKVRGTRPVLLVDDPEYLKFGEDEPISLLDEKFQEVRRIFYGLHPNGVLLMIHYRDEEVFMETISKMDSPVPFRARGIIPEAARFFESLVKGSRASLPIKLPEVGQASIETQEDWREFSLVKKIFGSVDVARMWTQAVSNGRKEAELIESAKSYFDGDQTDEFLEILNQLVNEYSLESVCEVIKYVVSHMDELDRQETITEIESDFPDIPREELQESISRTPVTELHSHELLYVHALFFVVLVESGRKPSVLWATEKDNIEIALAESPTTDNDVLNQLDAISELGLFARWGVAEARARLISLTRFFDEGSPQRRHVDFVLQELEKPAP